MRAFLACLGYGPREVARCATYRKEQSSFQNGHDAEGVGFEPVAGCSEAQDDLVTVFIETATPAAVPPSPRPFGCTDFRAGSRPELAALCQEPPRSLSPSPERNQDAPRGENPAPGSLASAPTAPATSGVKLTTLDQLLAQVDEPIWVGEGAHGAVARGKAGWRLGVQTFVLPPVSRVSLTRKTQRACKEGLNTLIDTWHCWIGLKAARCLLRSHHSPMALWLHRGGQVDCHRRGAGTCSVHGGNGGENVGHRVMGYGHRGRHYGTMPLEGSYPVRLGRLVRTVPVTVVTESA